MAPTAPTKPRRRAGRPSALDRVLGTDDDGAPITVRSVVADTIGRGCYIEDAASRCGVSKATFYNWQRAATRARAALAAGTLTVAQLTDDQRDALAFLDVVERAEAEAKLGLVSLADQLARGGIVQETVTERVERLPVTIDGQTVVREVVVERTTRRSSTLPDGPMLRWRLERRWRHEFGPGPIEVTGPNGGPVQLSTQERAKELADELRTFLTGAAAGAEAAAIVGRNRKDAPRRGA
jgi:hypothetical protein